MATSSGEVASPSNSYEDVMTFRNRNNSKIAIVLEAVASEKHGIRYQDIAIVAGKSGVTAHELISVFDMIRTDKLIETHKHPKGNLYALSGAGRDRLKELRAPKDLPDFIGMDSPPDPDAVREHSSKPVAAHNAPVQRKDDVVHPPADDEEEAEPEEEQSAEVEPPITKDPADSAWSGFLQRNPQNALDGVDDEEEDEEEDNEENLKPLSAETPISPKLAQSDPDSATFDTKIMPKSHGGNGHLDQVTIERIRKMRTEGRSYAEIKKEFGIGPGTIAFYAKGLGPKREALKSEYDGEMIICPRCKGRTIIKHGSRWTKAGRVQGYECKSCKERFVSKPQQDSPIAPTKFKGGPGGSCRHCGKEYSTGYSLRQHENRCPKGNGQLGIAPEVRAEVIKRLIEGQTEAQISDEIGLHHNTIIDIKRKWVSESPPENYRCVCGREFLTLASRSTHQMRCKEAIEKRAVPQKIVPPEVIIELNGTRKGTVAPDGQSANISGGSVDDHLIIDYEGSKIGAFPMRITGIKTVPPKKEPDIAGAIKALAKATTEIERTKFVIPEVDSIIASLDRVIRLSILKEASPDV